ncbi:MAG: hypothetical protein ACRC2T_11600, partial [Thermoguttaceae bacterium]
MILAENNQYTGDTKILGGKLEVQGSLGYDGTKVATYNGNIVNNGTLTFDNPPTLPATGTKVQVQVLNGNMHGTGSLEQYSDNLLVLNGKNNLTGAGNSSNVTIGKATQTQEFSAIEVTSAGTLQASGDLAVNSAGKDTFGNVTRDNNFNLGTSIIPSNTYGYRRGVQYDSNTTFGGTATFAAGSVWNVDTSPIANGDNASVLFATGGFANDSLQNANDALKYGNTMYFHSLSAANGTGGV